MQYIWCNVSTWAAGVVSNWTWTEQVVYWRDMGRRVVELIGHGQERLCTEADWTWVREVVFREDEGRRYGELD